MYLSKPAAFDEVLAVLEELEQRINRAGKNSTSSDRSLAESLPAWLEGKSGTGPQIGTAEL